MPTPSQLAALRRHANGQTNDDFVVHEVVELVDKGEEGFGQEDLLGASDEQQAAAVARRDAETKFGGQSPPSFPLRSSSSSSSSSSTPPARTITQSTFDAAVRENIDDLEMEEEEAIAEACEQFTAQGVSLEGIVTGLSR